MLTAILAVAAISGAPHSKLAATIAGNGGIVTADMLSSRPSGFELAQRFCHRSGRHATIILRDTIEDRIEFRCIKADNPFDAAADLAWKP